MMEIARYKKNEYLQQLDNLIKTLNEASYLGIDVSNVYQETIDLKEQVEVWEDMALDTDDDEIKLELSYSNPSFAYKYELDDIKRKFPTELKVLLEKNINILELPEWIKDVIKKNPLWRMNIINNIENIIAKNYTNILASIPELYRYIPWEDRKDNLEIAKISVVKDVDLLSSVPLILINSNREEFREAFMKNGIDLDGFLKEMNILQPIDMFLNYPYIGEKEFYSLEDISEEMQIKYPEKVREIVSGTGSLEGTCAIWRENNSGCVTKLVMNDFNNLAYTSPEWQIEHSDLVQRILKRNWDMLQYISPEWQAINSEFIKENISSWISRLKNTSPEWQVANSKFVTEIVKEKNYCLEYTCAEWQMLNSEFVTEIVKEKKYYLEYTCAKWQIANSELVSKIVSKYKHRLEDTSAEWQVANAKLVIEIVSNDCNQLEYTKSEWQMANSKFVVKVIKLYPKFLKYTCEEWRNANEKLVTKILNNNPDVLDDKDKKEPQNVNKNEISVKHKKMLLPYSLDLKKIADVFPVKEEELFKYSRNDVQYLVKAIQSCEYKKLEHINKIIEALKKEKNNIPTQENMGVVAKEILQHQAKESLLKTAENRIRNEIGIIEKELDEGVAKEFTTMLQELQQQKNANMFDNKELYKKFLDELISLYSKVSAYLQCNIDPKVLRENKIYQSGVRQDDRDEK